MGQPAARLTDMHVCPMVTGVVPHVGGPIVATGAPNVVIGGIPAARVTDTCVCVGPPDVLVKGSATVLIGGLPAARMGDVTAHGGVIVVGLPTVLIGDAPGTGMGGGSSDLGAGAASPGALSDDGTGAPANAPSARPKWTADEIKKEWQKTERGKQILQSLPKSTQFKAYKKNPGESRNAYYSPKENVIYIPDEYTSLEAAPTAAHEAVHADQVQNHKRPKDANDKIEMEVEAKNAGLDVYEQMNRPATPYNYKSEVDYRKSNQTGYNEAVRKTYKKLYNVK